MTPGLPFSDDNAIAPDKSAYLPDGSLATFANVSSYSRGINGIMVDLNGGGNHTSISANDFVFKHGNNNAPSTWAAVPATPTISVRVGAGISGSDRVKITWAASSIKNEWLEVQVLATANTGLTATDVFFWGSKIGDVGTGTPATTFLTSAADKTTVLGSLSSGVAITNTRDFNRDGNVTAADATIAFGSVGSIQRIQILAAGPFAPASDGGTAAVTPSLAAATTGSGAAAAISLAGPAGRLENLELNSDEIADFFYYLAVQNTPGTRQMLHKIDVVDDKFGLDDESLDSILAEFGLE